MYVESKDPLVRQVKNELGNSHYSVGVFSDLSKAFYTNNHVILIDKLERYEIRFAANWIHNYRSNRTQYVCINDVNSEILPIICGVPQDPFLDPSYLFSI